MRLRRGRQGREPAQVARLPAVHPTLTLRSCAAKSSSLTPAGEDYACYVTCASTLGAQTLDTMQSNVVVVAPGYRSGVSYTSCRYSGGGVWCGEGPTTRSDARSQYNPFTGALSQASQSQNIGCAPTTRATLGCCYSLATSSA